MTATALQAAVQCMQFTCMLSGHARDSTVITRNNSFTFQTRLTTQPRRLSCLKVERLTPYLSSTDVKSWKINLKRLKTWKK